MKSLATSKALKIYWALPLLFIAIAMCLTSCKSNGDVVPYGQQAQLNIINADTASVNVYQNGARINSISTISPGGITGYIPVAFGTTVYQVKKDGATNYLINGYSMTLVNSLSYTLFIGGETVDKIFSTDDSHKSPGSNASIRFVDAANTTTNFDVYIGSNLNFSDQPFKTVTNFNNIAAGTYAVSVYPHGSATALLKGSIILAAGSTYTFFVKGIPGTTGLSKFSATLLVN
jgi:hypothetical protein